MRSGGVVETRPGRRRSSSATSSGVRAAAGGMAAKHTQDRDAALSAILRAARNRVPPFRRSPWRLQILNATFTHVGKAEKPREDFSMGRGFEQLTARDRVLEHAGVKDVAGSRVHAAKD